MSDDLAHPYEPLILFFERGGEFSREHGYFLVDAAMFRGPLYETMLSRSPVASLDPEALDAMDDAGTAVAMRLSTGSNRLIAGA